MFKQFGGPLTRELKERYARSPNWKDGEFQNLVETSINLAFRDFLAVLYRQFTDRSGRQPSKCLPLIPLDKSEFLAPSKSNKYVWFGHSALLMRTNGKTILIDPMLGPDASPIAPFSTRRFCEGTLGVIDQLPDIDLLVLSHDHYDHLDLASMKKLIPRVNQFFVALGTARHLIRWGVPEEKITEFDWWDQQDFENIAICYTPSRHFSGRGLGDRFRSLWGGWTFRTASENIYFSGDGGYGAHFKEVGSRLGPFDFGMMECGQYSDYWPETHMFPEESVQAAIDAGVRKAMPVHWGGFALAQHHWKDPVERFLQAATESGHKVVTPRIGELFDPQLTTAEKWWEDFE